MSNRPIYESSHDRANEAAVAEAFGKAAGLGVTKTPRLCSVDFEADEDGILTAYLEVKCRNNNRRRYPTLFISKEKIDNALEMANRAEVALVLIIRWSDGIHYHIVEDVAEYTILEGGRRDRGDPKDFELVYHIPVDLFEPVIA